MRKLWSFLQQEKNRHVLGWLGGGVVVLASGVWVVVTFFYSPRPPPQASLETYIQQLQSASLPERISAIAGIEEIGIASANTAPRICDVLSSFVRISGKESNDSASTSSPDDAQRAVSAISQLLSKSRCSQVDLTRTDLRRLQLPNGWLPNANLAGANLQEANLRGADLSRARLIGADLTDVVLRQAKLRSSVLNQVTWGVADLRNADLSGAQGLSGADLKRVKAEGIVLDDVDLRRVRFPPSLKGASLDGANLRQTDLTQVKGLCESTVRKAQTDQTTKEPEKYDC